MLRRHRQIRTQLHQLIDACIFAYSFWFAYHLREHPWVIEWLGLDPVAPFERYIWFYLALILAGPLVLESLGFYDRPQLGSRTKALWILFRGVLITTLGLVIALFFFRYYIARWVPIWFGGICFGLLVAKEEIVRWYWRKRLSLPQFQRRFVLVGAREETARLRQQLERHPDSNIRVVAELTFENGACDRLVHLLHEQAVNGVIIAAAHSSLDQVEALVRACELEGVEAWLVADFFKTEISRASFDDFYGRPVMVFRSTPEVSWQSVVKQLLDYVLALVALLILAIPMGIIALLIKITSPGPVLFRQLRAGLNGAPFTMYKFRTMISNAEQLKHELERLNEMQGPVFKVTNDPRVTPLGRFLRRFSLDELPQLFNVLRGEMSIVGPRPLPVDEVRRIHDPAHRRRLSVKPGLTCLWQVSGRNQIRDFREWVRLDLEYIDNWSLWLDLKILLRTIPAVLSGKGAK
ncbi:MAG: sugar transferase [Verrucomicrobiales bacterium]|nr:sugar transferase [Verrucomicrobiales bacterium]